MSGSERSANVPPTGTLCFDGDGKAAVGYGRVSGVPLCADECESEGGMQGVGCVCKERAL